MSRREFQFKDDKSDKFWNIELNGDSFAVNYGRSGTAGQTKEKTFESAAKAQAEHDKQIASKLKKGYAEIGGTAVVGTVASAVRPKKTTPKKKPVPAEKKAKEPPPIEIGNLRRTVELDPAQRAVVTWEARQSLTRPEPPAFELADAQRRLAAIQTARSSWNYEWNKAKVPDFPSPAEAQFWLLAHKRCRGGKTKPAEAAELLASEKFDGKMTWEEVAHAFKDSWKGPGNLFGCVAALLSTEEIVKFILRGYDSSRAAPIEGLLAYVIPYHEPAELEKIRDSLRETISPFLPANHYRKFPQQHYLGAMLGCHDEMVAVVANIPDDHYSNNSDWDGTHYQNPQQLIFGLPDRASVIAEFNRLHLKLRSPEEVISWLALTGLDALDVITASICSVTSKDDAAKIAKPIGRVVAPEMAVPALQVAIDSKAPQVGLEWLRKNCLEAAVGLVPAAQGSGKLAQAARDHLHQMRRSGLGAVLEAAKPHLDADAVEWLRREILETEEALLEALTKDELPQGLQETFDATDLGKPSAWLDPTSLPPIKIGSKKLADAEIAKLIASLKSNPLPASSPLAAALKIHADPNSLDGFAWKLFEAWIAMGSNSKEKWAMGAIGHLGGDGCVLNLTPLVRQWPGESQHQRAVFGLQCLRAINSETALMALNGIALKLKFKGLKEKAKEAMEEIAKSRGMTRDELADRIVPDCGLDETGSREFDFGPRQFKFVLAGEAKPMVRGADGKVRPNLPKPNKSDDPEKSAAAVADWKILKKLLRETLKIQSERFENAMITGRRWTAENFEAFIIQHPFMVNLARQLVFAVYDQQGKVTGTFRVTEDQSIADQNDDDAELPATGSIGVVHPAHLDDPTKSAWGEVLADYGIIPPFQQLGRTICSPEADDLGKTEITRFEGPKIPGIVMYGMLERSHWLRDTPADGGGFTQHSKYFEASDITAFIAYDPGLSIGWYDEDQQLTSIYFVKGHIDPEMWGDHKNRVKIGDVDQVVISEVLRLAHAIVAKGE